MRLPAWLRRLWLVVKLGAAAAVFVVAAAAIVVAAAAIVRPIVNHYVTHDRMVPFWNWLTNDESGSTTIRNVGLVIGAVVALVLTAWRINVANRQAEAAQQGLLYDRYQKSAEMLGGMLLAVRLRGIYALQQLATEHPKQFLRPIVRLYCAFVRHPIDRNDGETGGKGDAPEGDSKILREDVIAVMDAIVAFSQHPKTKKVLMRLSFDVRGAILSGADLSRANLSFARLDGADLSGADLSGADLSGAFLSEANLSGANLSGANLSDALLFDMDLSGANLSRANLSEARLHGADLSGAILLETDLSDANLWEANLSGAILSRANLSQDNAITHGLFWSKLRPVRGLTQAQLDEACADPEDPPDLGDVLGPYRSPLTWRGEPCEGSDP